MATFYPSIETIKKLKVQPTAGERALLNFLWSTLDDSYEVYFNPYLNGDRPDILIMRKGNGALIIEVKDWNLANFELNDKKKWVYTPNNSVVKSPIDQVLKYKNNLFDLHVDQLLEKKINDVRHLNMVACAVYFHCATQDEVENLLVHPYKKDKRYLDFLKYNVDLLGKDSLDKEKFDELLIKHYLHPSKPSFFFTDEIYQNFKRILSPTVHQKLEGVPYQYSPKQKKLIYSDILEQRVRGVFGSGKTTVLAARAVQAYKRALQWNANPRILILTYNITLKNFIHDKMMMVDEVFPIENFIVINYHSFINAELNNLNVDVFVPEDCSGEEAGDYLDRKYYSNINLFEEHKTDIIKYDAVLIDEIQDFRRPWMDIIKRYFREPDGDYVLFGDVKQNIYGQAIEKKDVVTNVLGVNELTCCYRSDFKVRDIAQSFQRNIFRDKYDIDEFDDTELFFGQKQEKQGYINYMYLQGENPIVSLYNIVRGNMLNKASDIAPNDITILGCSSKLLKTFDAYYRYASREKSYIMLETYENMYMTHLNYISKNNYEAEENRWFKNISEHLIKKMYPKKKNLCDSDFIKLRKVVASLFTIYDLYVNFNTDFKKQMCEECKKCGISFEAFMAYNEHYKEQLNQFREKVNDSDYSNIRNNKKLHFWMNCGMIKLSTIHSFKGWESEVVFLLLEPTCEANTYFNHTFDELLYTGITRARRDLVIINYGNSEYDKKLRPLVEHLK